MKRVTPLVLALALAFSPPSGTAMAQEEGAPAADGADRGAGTEASAAAGLVILDARDTDPGEFLWIARPLMIFADTPQDPRFILQMEMLEERPADLLEREVIVITDTDPAAKSAARERLHPNGFTFVLLDKDGTIILRKPQPWSTRELSRAIDKTPLRQEEIRARKEGRRDAVN